MSAVRILKKYKHLVMRVEVDSEITEVILHEGFINPYHETTSWVYPHDYLDYGSTKADRQRDLNGWLEDVLRNESKPEPAPVEKSEFQIALEKSIAAGLKLQAEQAA